MEKRQHQIEIEGNRAVWEIKPLLGEIYAELYGRLVSLVDSTIPGPILELGSGIGALKRHLPQALLSDQFPNPWLNLAADAYRIPFADGSLSHLLLFDVFHHLNAPRAFLKEARRVLVNGGRLLLCEPYISWTSAIVYGFFHHEPIGWRRDINSGEIPPAVATYYAAQGNATRIFFREPAREFLEGWTIRHRQAFASVSYLASGGFSKRSFYPVRWLPVLRKCDAILSRWPAVFGARCVVALERAP